MRSESFRFGFFVCFCLLGADMLPLAAVLRAQNLIPNAGFEEVFTALEYQWVQPQGAYYHYEKADPDGWNTAEGGAYINGLCMYNFRPNEYLHVKLYEPLKAGAKYRFSIAARLYKSKCTGAELQKYIGVHFGTSLLSTHIPGDLYLEPQLHLRLPGGDKFQWFTMVDTLTASGGESYLTIGYFPNTQEKEMREKITDEFFRELDARYNRKSQVTEDDKSWLYLPPEEQKKYLKANKKLKKVKEEAPRLQDSLEFYNPDRSETIAGEFTVRYYFDNLCLHEITADSTQDWCKPQSLTETITVGNTIQLRNVFFDTGDDNLKSESEIQLRALLEIMNQHPKMEIKLLGYTDNVGDDSANLELSERRAMAVSRWLQNEGVEASRITAMGMGEASPVESNDTEAGRARNRRVTFTIMAL